MALRYVELYEALKGPVGVEAARMIAEAVPPAEDIATRHDLAMLRSDFSELRSDFSELRSDFSMLRSDFSELRSDVKTEIAELRGEMRTEFAHVRTEMAQGFGELESRIMGRLWVMFVPLWIGVFGLIATLLVRGG